MPRFPDADAANPLADDCRRCPALAAARECISWGNGPLDASLVVVGEAPGAGDPAADRWQGGNWTGMAYTSRASGRKVRDLLADAGYGHEQCYFTNAVKCYPPDGSGGNREPTPEERANCRPYLLEEVEQVDPACVVATGRHATQSLLAIEGRELDGFLDVVLEPLTVAGLPTVLPLLHPSYQEVWLSRLDYDRAGYVDAIRETLDDLV